MIPSIFQNTTAAAAAAAPRSRRPRGESESRRSNGARMDSGGRRQKEFSSRNNTTTTSATSSTDRRSPPSKSTSPSASIYSQPNITHDSALASPSSGENSPISPRSPDLRPEMKAGQVYNGPGGFFQLAAEPQTPAALLQYLDTEDEDVTAEPLGKAKTESNLEPQLHQTHPTLRPQPASIQRHRERDFNSQANQQHVRKEYNVPTARPRTLTSRPRPQSAFIQHYDYKKDEQDETPMSEPETSAKQSMATNRARRQINVPGTFVADSSTDSTDSTDGTDGTTDDDDDDDDESTGFQTETPRPVNQGPSLPPVPPPVSAFAEAPAALPSAAPKLERTTTVVHHQEKPSTETAHRPQKQDGASESMKLSNASKAPPVPNILQYLQVEDDQTTPTQEQQKPKFVASNEMTSTASSSTAPKPHQSIASQYFATQKTFAAAQPLKREDSDSGSKSAVGAAPLTSTTTTATTSGPAGISKEQSAILQYLEKEEKTQAPAPVPAAQPAPIQRESSHRSARSPSASRPAIQGISAAYMEKVPVAQPLQREPSNKGAKSPETSRPPMPLSSAAFFEKAGKAQVPAATAVTTSAAAPPRKESIEPPLKSPVATTRPLAHVFPAHHFYEATNSNASPSVPPAQPLRRESRERSRHTPPAAPSKSPAAQYAAVQPPAYGTPANPSRPLTPEASQPGDDQETVTGSPPHMSVSMPQLPASHHHTERFPPIHRAFTPPTVSMREPDPANMAQPMPMYPYAMQDPRAFYTSQFHNMQHGNPYMMEPQYSYAPPAMPPPPPGPFYSNSPDPYRHRHRMSMVSVSAESAHTPEAIEQQPPSINHTRPTTGRASPQDESSELLSRIQHALPDLQMLLSRCEEVTGHHKETVKRAAAATPDTDVAHQEALKQKTLRIDELEKELDVKSQLHATERNKMRFEIGNLQEKYHDLQDELVAIQKRRKSLDETPAQLEAFRKEVDGLKRELEGSLLRQRELTEAKRVAEHNIVSLEAQLKALNSELDVRKLAEASLQNRFNETLSAHNREREALAAQGKTEQRHIEDKQTKDRYELEAALRSREAKLEDVRKTWNREKEELQRAWQKEKEEMQRGWHKEKEDLLKTHSKDKDDLVRGHAKEKDDLHRGHVRDRDELVRTHEDVLSRVKADADKEARGAARKHEKAQAELERNLEAKFDEQYKEIETDNIKLRRDYKRVKRDWHLDKERGREEREKLRVAAGKMQAEHGSLMKLLEAFSEPTERDKEREEKRERREKEQQLKKDDTSQQG